MNKKNIWLLIIGFVLISLVSYTVLFPFSIKLIDFKDKSLEYINKYKKKYDLNLEIKKEYSMTVEENKLINQIPKSNKMIKRNTKITLIYSKGPFPYKKYKVNELGDIPIMMYHGIADTNKSMVGGNVDKDGYTRTKKAFINDLEMYYRANYRMIRLTDYINGKINTSLGMSPLVLTFDDGNINNIEVTGKDENGNLIINPNSAVGILESFKNKYPNYNVTATFFLNEGLFQQPKYNYEILKWLIKHGYDVGNHTKDHVNFDSININDTQYNVAYMYKLFDEIIPNKYAQVVSLPFGSPYTKTHTNFNYILNGSYNGYSYKTEATLRVGWEPNSSPFNINFDRIFIKRIRAWDNNGKDFDIKMCFNQLENTRYISDGNINTIVIPNDKYLNKNIRDKKIIKY